MLLHRIFNLGLRGLTLASKFLLIFFLSKYLTSTEVGVYGLIVVTISYTLYFLGFDFYTFSTRDIIKQKKEQWGKYLKSQVVFFLIMYLIVLPLSYLPFICGLLPIDMFFWFLLLLVLEHLNQELGRFLVVASKQTVATIVLFFRSGIWCLAVIALFLYDNEFHSLKSVFILWSGGSFCAFIIAILQILKLPISGWREETDWRWIKKGLRIAFPFLIGTLALRGLQTLDRFWFEYLTSREVLGAYVLFSGMCNALISFLDAGVFMYSYPKLIMLFYSNNMKKFYHEMRQMTYLVLFVSFGFLCAAMLILPSFLSWLDKVIYIENMYLFWLLLLAAFLNSLSMVSHFGLYALGFNKIIITSHIFAIIVFLSSVKLLSNLDGKLAVPISLSVAYFFILFCKTIFLVRSRYFFNKKCEGKKV